MNDFRWATRALRKYDRKQLGCKIRKRIAYVLRNPYVQMTISSLMALAIYDTLK